MCRFVFVLDGAVNLTDSKGAVLQELHPDSYAFFPAGDQHRQACYLLEHSLCLLTRVHWVLFLTGLWFAIELREIEDKRSAWVWTEDAQHIPVHQVWLKKRRYNIPSVMKPSILRGYIGAPVLQVSFKQWSRDGCFWKGLEASGTSSCWTAHASQLNTICFAPLWQSVEHIEMQHLISIFRHRFGMLQGKPTLQYGTTGDKPVLPVPGEVFALRKLLPATSEYDFNIHIMDFHPGEYLNVKVLHSSIELLNETHL